MTLVAVLGVFGTLFFRRIVRKQALSIGEKLSDQAVSRDRYRIARDIHDDLGANLTQIALLSELTQADLGDPERARTAIPTLAMITAAPQALAQKARKLAAILKKSLAGRYAVTTLPGASRVGGGAFPERDLPTTLVALSPLPGAPSPNTLRERLLATEPPLIARTQDATLLLDVRTLADDELKLVAAVLRQALEE